tara:strand:+ start:57459 stop:58172 length:714 start_codon:yes stop_codon:yes gene_type:complete
MKRNIKKVLILGLNNVGNKIARKLSSHVKNLKIIKKKIALKEIHKYNPDIIFSLGYRFIIPDEVINYPKYGCYNIHKSMLPLNKGANPVFWTILNNTTAGISIHKVSSKIDSGQVYEQKKIIYDFSFNAKKLYEKMENEQFKQFFIFWKKLKNSKEKPKKVSIKKTSLHKKKDFQKMMISKSLQNKGIKNFINLLRASTFPPFNNIKIKDKKKVYKLELVITEINSKKKRYGFVKSY